MGACASSGGFDAGTISDRERDRALDKKLKDENRRQEEIVRLLLLGAGQSGKSTLFKQMISIYGDGMSEEEMESYRPIIYGNVLGSMQTLLEQHAVFVTGAGTNGTKESKIRIEALSTENKAAKDNVENAVGDDRLTPALGAQISALWTDPAIQATYARRSEFQLNESASYYFGEVKRIADPDYTPTEQDVLRSRSRTTGVIETRFTIQGHQFQMYDVGGQRSERKKWIHCFEDVTCVLFIAAISAYNQLLFEDNATNRLVESLDLFGEVANSRWFTKTAIVLFLNKTDLFREKVKTVSLTVCPALVNYDGDAVYEDALEYITDTFLEKTEKDVIVHATCATDKHNVNLVFDSVKEVVLDEILRMGGLD